MASLSSSLSFSTSEYLLSSLRWRRGGWLVGGVWVGVDLIFINISRVARAQRAASLPTNPRGPHVETDTRAKKNERKKEGERKREKEGER